MTNKSRAEHAVRILKKNYPNAACTLIYNTPLQLLIAIRLSAQCTDTRVNMITPALFKRFRTLEDFANAMPKTIEKYIYSCGFYKTKSINIADMCKIILNHFNGYIPNTIEDLTFLPGIGRKSANLFLGETYKIPGIIVDTHFARVTQRLGFHNTKNTLKIEKIMKKLIPPYESLTFCHQIVAHGRIICTAARLPKCNECCLKKICKYALAKL